MLTQHDIGKPMSCVSDFLAVFRHSSIYSSLCLLVFGYRGAVDIAGVFGNCHFSCSKSYKIGN